MNESYYANIITNKEYNPPREEEFTSNYQKRDWVTYMHLLFADETLQDKTPVITYFLHEGKAVKARLEFCLEHKICGGTDFFFAPETTILELGSGAGIALEGFAELYRSRNIAFLGVDDAYRDKIPKGKSPITLIGANWRNIPLPDNAIDRFLSVESVLRYYDGHYRDDAPDQLPEADIDFIRTITRLAKQGAIWRSNISASAFSSLGRDPRFIRTMLDYGWQVFIYKETMIAILLKKDITRDYTPISKEKDDRAGIWMKFIDES